MRGITIIKDNVSIHTGLDLDLVQESKSIGMPKVQSYTVEVPGRNGLLNLTKGLTGGVNYYNRTLTFTFFGAGAREDLVELMDSFNVYHGEYIKIIDDDTPDDYYEGEATVSYKDKGSYIIITLKVDANPFRLRLNITNVNSTLSSSSKNVVVTNNGVPVIPTITVSSSATIAKGDRSYTLSQGTYTLNNMELARGSNVFTVSGTGSITITFREARL